MQRCGDVPKTQADLERWFLFDVRSDRREELERPREVVRTWVLLLEGIGLLQEQTNKYGRVSRHGAMALCWSLDKLGPMCRNARDAAIVFEVIQGPDGLDPTVADQPFTASGPLSVMRVRARGMKALAVTPYFNISLAAPMVIATMPALAAA